jgi:hypothetical protein
VLLGQGTHTDHGGGQESSTHSDGQGVLLKQGLGSMSLLMCEGEGVEGTNSQLLWESDEQSWMSGRGDSGGGVREQDADVIGGVGVGSSMLASSAASSGSSSSSSHIMDSVDVSDPVSSSSASSSSSPSRNDGSSPDTTGSSSSSSTPSSNPSIVSSSLSASTYDSSSRHDKGRLLWAVECVCGDMLGHATPGDLMRMMQVGNICVCVCVSV